MKVALVNHEDFAFGTSSRSSKLIHGGLRYLEHAHFSLVRESLQERQTLLTIAPHLVKPLKFVFPIYGSDRISPLKMRMGLFLYDFLSLFESPSMHKYLSAKNTLKHFPYLRKKDLRCGFVYWDASMEDALLVIENLRSATNLGAFCFNYLMANKVKWNEEGGFQELECKDELVHKTLKLKGRHIVSCLGPWTDKMGKAWFPSHWKPKLHLSKGAHIWIPRNKLPLSSALVLGDNSNKRIVFAIPHDEKVLIGTTDTEHQISHSIDKVEAQNSDWNYPSIHFKSTIFQIQNGIIKM